MDVLKNVVPIVALVFAGWGAVRLKILKAEDASVLTEFFMYLAAPALLITLLVSEDLAALFDIGFVVSIVVMFATTYIGAYFIAKVVLRRTISVSAFLALTVAMFNSVLIGLPVLIALVGKSEAVVATTINLIVALAGLVPITLILYNYDQSRDEGTAWSWSPVLSALTQTIQNPLIIATVIGIILSVFLDSLPSMVNTFLTTLGGATLPTALVAVGMTITFEKFSSKRTEIIAVSLARTVLSPLIAIGLALALDLSANYATALVIMFCLPTAKTVFVLTENYHTYADEAASIVAITTVAAVVILPAFGLISEAIWPGVIR